MASYPVLTIPTDAEAKVDAVRRRAIARNVKVPAALDGKYALVMLVALDANATDAQINTLVTAMEAISGVARAVPFLGPSPIPASTSAPAGYDVHAVVEARWSLEPEPVV